MVRKGKVPIRRCVGCGERNEKLLFERLSYRDGQMVVGAPNGRGCYVHRRAACIQKLLDGRSLRHSLRIPSGSVPMEALHELLKRVLSES